MKKVVLVDIEGTITDINFVYNVLFPYAKEHMNSFLKEHYSEPQIQSILIDIFANHFNESKDQVILSDLSKVSSLLMEWMQADQKITELKALQGYLWQEGYTKGKYQGHLYDDAFSFLSRCKKDGHKLYVYSSGSVKAQKLLFDYCDKGNITHMFSGFFDTNIGMKQQVQSYVNIQKEINAPTEAITFFSDVPAELEAAASAKFNVCLLNRDQKIKDSKFLVINDFSEFKEF